MNDPVSPNHYKGSIECIDAMRACMSEDQFEGFLRGNVIKYVYRYRARNGVDDLRKAQVYLDWLIELLNPSGADGLSGPFGPESDGKIPGITFGVLQDLGNP